MSDVKWIKLKVGMFDGKSFKKIRRAKIGGESFRDKLTAVWFELMDFAGKCNHSGAFIDSHEIPFTNIEDIAIMIDRETEELELCMRFFANEGMITIVDDIYMLSNWSEYQNEIGLEEIRRKNRERQAKHREKKRLLLEGVTSDNTKSNVTVTSHNTIDIDKEREKEGDNKKKSVKENSHTLFERLLPDYNIPFSVSEKLKEWLTYKTERKEPYKEQGMKSFLRQVENKTAEYGEQAICDLIDECMSSGWKGIIYDRLQQKSSKSINYGSSKPQSSNNDFFNELNRIYNEE